jgi:hypothetical protein
VNERSDLIRRMGARGSDLPGLSAGARELNAHLDKIFGGGKMAPLAIAKNVTSDAAIDPSGTTYFVDYDAAFGSLIGHGVYTKVDAMLFHAVLATDHFFQSAA